MVYRQALRKIQETELEGAEGKKGVLRMDRIKKYYIRGTEQVRWLGDEGEARRRWFGHKDGKYMDRGILMLELPGRRPRPRPKRS